MLCSIFFYTGDHWRKPFPVPVCEFIQFHYVDQIYRLINKCFIEGDRKSIETIGLYSLHVCGVRHLFTNALRVDSQAAKAN